MLLPLNNTKHINTLVHEGKTLIVATVQNGAVNELHYTVKQDGFEDSALQPDSIGWEKFRRLDLPAEPQADPSVERHEQENFTDKTGQALLRSRYHTARLTADAPVQLVSHDGLVWIFRQSTENTLLLDRYVLDGMTNTLNRRLEVRFKRSRQRYTPSKPGKISGNGQMAAADSVDFRDVDGKPFYEPSLEILPGLLKDLQNGHFAAVVTPTDEKDVHRWHFFAALAGKVTLVSLRSGEDQVFDIGDQRRRSVDPDTDAARYQSIPGIDRREFVLNQADGSTALTITQGLSAVRYDVQRLARTDSGEDILARDVSKVMLAVPTDQGIAALNFSVALDGRLAEISTPSVISLREERREIPLPLTVLDNIKAFGKTREAPGGVISAIQRSADEIGTDCLQVETASGLDGLKVGDTVTLKSTPGYEGLYTVDSATVDGFCVKAEFGPDGMGTWEKVEEEAGLISDGMVTRYARNADGTLAVKAVNHGLKPREQVQLVGSTDCDGDYLVIAKGQGRFTIQRPWPQGEAISIAEQSRKRRGLVFDGLQDHVRVPFAAPVKCTGGFTIEAWVRQASGLCQALVQLVNADSAGKALRRGFAGKDVASITTALASSKPEQDFTLSVQNDRLAVSRATYGVLPEGTALLDDQAGQYICDYPDLRKAFGTDRAKAADHYQLYGRKEKRVIRQDDPLVSGTALTRSIWTHVAAVYRPESAVTTARFAGGALKLPNLRPDFSQGLSIEAWICLDELMPWMRIIDLGADKGGSYIVLTTSENRQRLRFYVFDKQTDKSVQSLDVLVAKRWMHVAATIDGDGKVLMYADGNIVSPANSTLPKVSDEERPLGYIGKSNQARDPNFRGQMSGVRLWSRARTQDEIRAGMRDRGTVQDAQLVLSWPPAPGLPMTSLGGSGKARGSLIGDVSFGKLAPLTLSVDGVPSETQWITPLELDAEALTIAARACTTTEGLTARTSQYLQGEMSELRLWNTARTADEIKDSMHLQLTGRETGLAGYWKLGGIAEEDGRMRVVDFSVHANHGEACGAPYAGGAVLARTLKDGNTLAVRYGNDELFAVVEGASYEECFEFKLSAGVDPSNVDPKTGKVFVPDLWGRSGRTSAEKMTVAPDSGPDFEALGGGWYTLRCNFTIPEGMRLFRCFGLKDVNSGSWDRLEVRRHRITLLSDTVRRSDAVEALSLAVLPLAPAAAAETLKRIRTQELQEAGLATQSNWLEGELAQLRKLKQEQEATDQRALEKKKQDQAGKVEAAQKAYADAKAVYDAAVADDSNYWFRIQNRNSLLYLDADGPDKRVVQKRKSDSDSQLWQKILVDKVASVEFFKILCRNAGTTTKYKCLDAYGAWKNSGDPIVTYDDLGKWNQQWELLHQRSYDGSDHFSIRPRHSDKVLDVWGWSKDEGGVVNQGNCWPDSANQKFRFVRSDVQTDEGAESIRAAQKVMEDRKKDYDKAKGEGLTLNQTVAQTVEKITRYEAEKTTIDAALSAVRAKIAADTTAYLADGAKGSGNALLMPVVPDRHAPGEGYPEELRVQAALLTGVSPATRAQALESCAGLVTLSFQDAHGRMQQVQYDTTYDRDGKGEQWLASPLSTALKRDGIAVAMPATAFEAVSSQLTVEFWAKADATTGWEHLAHDGGSFTLTREELVRYGAGQVWISKTLPPGTYKDFHTADVFGQDPVSAQRKSCQKAVDAVVLHAAAQNRTVLRIVLPDLAGRLVWAAGQGDGVIDNIGAPVSPGMYRGGWTHWTFVKDADKGEMKVYANGRLFCSNTVDPQKSETRLLQPLGGITAVTLGASWRGAIAELRIWSEALGEQEIAMNSLTPPSGSEPGLMAYYRMDEVTGDLARDRTGRNAALTGVAGRWTPCTLPLSPSGVMSFDGQSDHLQLPTLNPDFTAGLSIEAWIFLDELTGWMRIVDLCADNNRGYIILSTSEDKTRLRVYVFDDVVHPGVLSTGAPLAAKQWIHVAATIDKDGGVTMYANGAVISSGNKVLPARSEERMSNYIGKSHVPADPRFKGRMHSVRLWNRVLTAQELQAGMYRPSTGKESGLVAAWLEPRWPLNAPVSLAEYGRTRVNAEKQKSAMMLRLAAAAGPAGVTVYDEQRIEELEMRWVGNAQIKPTLLGYVEGAPPVPSENLTIEDDYNGATSVELVQSSEVSYSWTREQDVSSGASAEAFIGADSETFAGVGVATSIEGVHQGFKGNLEFAQHWQNASTVSASQGLANVDRLELRGSKEDEPRFPHLGSRFIPKNVGYALVVSGLADVYVSRLRRSRRMVGYQVLPTEGIPLDINTITFLMNPAYTMAGSLDGLTGSAATSSRFFGHVPAMRNQYGALYPASYLRLTEAYRLKDQIDKQDANHRSYFENFNARLVDETSLNRQVDDNSRDGQGVSLDSSTGFSSQSSPELDELDRQIEEVDASIKALEAKPSSDDKTQLPLYRARKDELQNKRQQLAKAEQDRRTSDNKERQRKIADRHSDLSAMAHAKDSFMRWQTKMENLRIRAGKRNIVNTYVWDGDGGFRAEEQQFADTVEHSVGGSFDFTAALGLEGEWEVSKAAVALTVQATVALTQTMSKTQSRASAMELHVDLGGVESRGITDYKDRPLMPGEKVDRYRFMTFYLEKSTNHWHDFFNQVVDPEWLASNDEEARALRQAQLAAPNQAWRVLHRVTYVERPALMGFGRDVRALAARAEEDETVATLRELKLANKQLEAKLDNLLATLNTLAQRR